MKKRIGKFKRLTIFRDRFNDKICIYLGTFQTISPLGFAEKTAKIYEIGRDGQYYISGYAPEISVDAEVIGHIGPDGKFTEASE